jgi:hypothetical protein
MILCERPIDRYQANVQPVRRNECPGNGRGAGGPSNGGRSFSSGSLRIIWTSSDTDLTGWEPYVKLFDTWMDPRFKATLTEIRDLKGLFGPDQPS